MKGSDIISNLGANINYFIVFFEGVVSFFSPCVIPLIPLYISYLAGNAKSVDENGNLIYERKKVFLHTFFFVLGISSAFFILGLGFSTLGVFARQYRDILSKIGGFIIIVLGLNQMGIIKISFLKKEFRINKKASLKNMNPVSAFIMGFLFSFAWTPCVGPALASVLILASNASSAFVGNLLVFLYAIGFVIPFLVLGIFTSQTLNFIRKRSMLMSKIVKIGGLVLVIMGLMLALGTFGKFENLFNGIGGNKSNTEMSSNESKNNENSINSDSKGNESEKENDNKSESNKQAIIPINLKDQNGNQVNVGDFKGKVVFINFFATWCPPCKEEIPDIQKLYEENGYNKNDVIILGIASPDQGREQDENGVKEFIKNYKITYPVLMDNSGEVFASYGVSSLPTTFFVDKNSNVFGYATGLMSKKNMEMYISQTKEGK